MKKRVTLFRDGDNYGAFFYDGTKKTTWDKLTRQEQIDIVGAMATMYGLFYKFIKKEDAV